MRHLFPALALAALTLTLTAGCGDAPSSPANSATLTVRLTDSPFSSAQAVLVTFSTVSVHLTGGGFTRLPFASTLPSGGTATSRTCDLKKLEGPQDVMGTVNLPAGDYTQIRLLVTSANLFFDNPTTGEPCAPSIPPPAGANAPVTVPSDTIKLNRPFTLAAGTATNVLLDFDGDKSIHQTGNGTYIMNPVIGVVNVW